jgi:N-hydroxyarylamine O-acetyltransferase
MSFPLDEYCQRTGVSSIGAATIDRLADLQTAQLYAMPFENLDIQLGRGIDLSPAHLIEKLIRRQRGGYCFELNGLFLSALHTVGFEARPLLARVHVSGEPTGRSHQLSLVTINGKEWITDVGFGGACPREPIPLEQGMESTQGPLTFRLESHTLGTMLQLKQADGTWQNLYSFDLTPVVANDIAYGNHFTSTHPSSFFTTTRIAVRWSAEGQTRLFNFSVTTSAAGQERTEALPDDDDYLSELSRRFGIELDAAYSDLRPVGVAT